MNQTRAPQEDAALGAVLKQFDPSTPPTRAELVALQAAILAETRQDTPAFPVWMLGRGANSRMALAAVAFALMSGFAVGHFALAPAATTVAGMPALMMLADQTLSDQREDASDAAEGDDDVQ